MGRKVVCESCGYHLGDYRILTMKKKKALIILSSVAALLLALVCAWPVIYLHIADCHIVNYGIDDYSPVDSSTSLCKYLTLRKEEPQVDRSRYFVNRYPWLDAFYRYEEKTFGGTYHETVLLALSYNESNYSKVFEDISSQPGFSPALSFDYGDLHFRLNDAEKLDGEGNGYIVQTNFKTEGADPYLGWINLVGWSESRHVIIYLGFVHAAERWTGFWEIGRSYYPFQGWDKLFEEEFSFYDWNGTWTL